MKTSQSYIRKITKDEIIIEIIPLLNRSLWEEIKHAYFDFDIEKKYKFGHDRYIIKYKPKVDNFDIRFSHSGTFYDRELQRVYKLVQYTFWCNKKPIAIFRIIYPDNDYYTFHNEYQKSFVVFK